MDVYARMKELGVKLPPAPAKGGVYTPAREFGEGEKLIYVSGCGPQEGPKSEYIGKLGKEMTLEQGQQAARNCALNILAVLEAKLGDLNKIKKFVKMTAFVSSESTFTQQPQVANGASQLLVDIFGDAGAAARSAIAVNVLPGDIAVENEILLEMK